MRNKLIEFRGHRTQEEMANIYNVSQQAWSNWENGRDTPRPATMLLISKDAGLSIEALFFDEVNNKELLTDSTGTDG
jgi:DNA-binding XRE family transcriptional regulator